MNVLHANWSDGALCLWVESGSAFRASNGAGDGEHPFAGRADQIRSLLALNGLADATREVELKLRLPAAAGAPIPSPSLAHAIGHSSDDLDGHEHRVIDTFTAPALAVDPAHAIGTIDALLDRFEDSEAGWSESDAPRSLTLGPGVAYFAIVIQFARYLLTQERFVPMLEQQQAGTLGGVWMPWMGDSATAELLAPIVEAMPPAARAVIDRNRHDAWTIVGDMVGAIVDAECRKALIDDDMAETIEGRETSDTHVAWLTGLLNETDSVPAGAAMKPEMIRSVRGWVGGLEERGAHTTWRLAFRLNEPVNVAVLEDFQAPPDDLQWHLSFHLRPVDAPNIALDAVDVWALASDAVTIDGHRIESPQELLLAELGRASRLYRPLEKALDESEPVELPLSTIEAYEFLREIKPLLFEQGFAVDVPDWWDSPSARLGARLQLEGDSVAESADSEGSTTPNSPQLGLNTLVNYRWEIEVGDVTLTLREFEQLAERKSPLVRVNGRWVEIRPEDVRAAIGFIRENPGGRMRIAEALRLAYASDLRETGVPVLGMDVSGWVGAMLGLDDDNKHLPLIETPEGFIGTLRPYQKIGLSWLAFMERFGFGLCLADDMGLGKTIQLLALMMAEREQAIRDVEAGAKPTPIGPTLLVVPMSVVGNWVHECKRFCPSLRSLVHHGVDRLQGDALIKAAEEADLVVTTYALVSRDRDQLDAIRWHRLVLDEAQYIKNPQAKQTTAVRSLNAERRVALTGTPVENRLIELWSIMEFLNPGYLGPAATFRRRFSVPIERQHDSARAEQLRGLVRPFILRRLKTDPDVVSDLPEKVETREYCHLTGEQAKLYQSCVSRMLDEVERAEGIQRRGLVLSTLIKLKQICNHPAQLLKDHDFNGADPPDPARSGKSLRIVEILDEVVAEGHQALVFTQFRQMGKLLSAMLRHSLDREVLFLHGGSSKSQREAMIEAFQRGDGVHPIFILSLKAGGVGLNLTAASHVIHYDRWWNPAVENQATDRAYRIGQTKTVQVHKFVVSGTLEERIDEMIERKSELARNIIGAGERWLTELDTDQLRQILSLRNESFDAE